MNWYQTFFFSIQILDECYWSNSKGEISTYLYKWWPYLLSTFWQNPTWNCRLEKSKPVRIFLIQVNLCQKHLFLDQPTHNMTNYCSLIYQFTTWKLQAQNMGRTCCVHKLFWMSKQKQKTICVHNMFSPCSELVVFMYWTGKSMNNLLSYCGLVDVRINASDKNLPVFFNCPGCRIFV